MRRTFLSGAMVHVQGLEGGNRSSNGDGGCEDSLYFDNSWVCSTIRKPKYMSIEAMEREDMSLSEYNLRDN